MALLQHVLLFLVLSFAICVMNAFYAEPEDGPALRSIPRRFLTFVLACAGVALLLLLLEHVFAGV